MQVSSKKSFAVLCALAATAFVILTQAPFPGSIGALMECIGRIALPLIMILFGYQASSLDVRGLRRRSLLLLDIEILTALIYFLWNLLRGTFSIDAPGAWLGYLILCKNPFEGRLWFLTAMAESHLLLWLFASIRDRKGSKSNHFIYYAGLFAMILHLTLSSIASASDMSVPFALLTNALLFGLPMLALGMFFHEHGERLRRSLGLDDRKLLLIALLGIVFSILEWMGGKSVELPVGTLFAVMALALLIGNNACALRHLQPFFGFCCLSSPLFSDVARQILTSNPYLASMITLVLCLLTGAMAQGLSLLFRKKPAEGRENA